MRRNPHAVVKYVSMVVRRYQEILWVLCVDTYFTAAWGFLLIPYFFRSYFSGWKSLRISWRMGMLVFVSLCVCVCVCLCVGVSYYVRDTNDSSHMCPWHNKKHPHTHTHTHRNTTHTKRQTQACPFANLCARIFNLRNASEKNKEWEEIPTQQ